MEHIGILGGSFNPPHIGHIRAAKHAAQALGLTRVLLVPASQVPHKQTTAEEPSPLQRLEMTRLAVQNEPLLEACSLEMERGGTSYTWDTIRSCGHSTLTRRLRCC